MFANSSFIKAFRVCLGLHIVVMIAGILHLSQKIFAIDMLTTLKLSLEDDRKHVLRLLRLCLDEDQA